MFKLIQKGIDRIKSIYNENTATSIINEINEKLKTFKKSEYKFNVWIEPVFNKEDNNGCLEETVIKNDEVEKIDNFLINSEYIQPGIWYNSNELDLKDIGKTYPDIRIIHSVNRPKHIKHTKFTKARGDEYNIARIAKDGEIYSDEYGFEGEFSDYGYIFFIPLNENWYC